MILITLSMQVILYIYKVHLMKECLERGIKMTRFKIADISKTYMDPMAKIIRNKLKRQGIKRVYLSCFLMKVLL